VHSLRFGERREDVILEKVIITRPGVLLTYCFKQKFPVEYTARGAGAAGPRGGKLVRQGEVKFLAPRPTRSGRDLTQLPTHTKFPACLPACSDSFS